MGQILKFIVSLCLEAFHSVAQVFGSSSRITFSISFLLEDAYIRLGESMSMLTTRV